MVVNRGSASGHIAASDSGISANETIGGAAGVGGEGNSGGRADAGSGGQDRNPPGLLLGSLSTWQNYGGLVHSALFEEWLDTYRALPEHDYYVLGFADTDAADGKDGFRGPDGPDGEEGESGTGELVVNRGTGSVETGGSLVYIHGGGTVTEGDALTFTIAR
ncbi:hypothetical protein AB9K41_11415, partial [Cribrihabitans sp. XS_ASV171]